MSETNTDATSSNPSGGTTEDSSDSSGTDKSTAASESTEGRANAPSGEVDVKIDLDSVPKELRSIAEQHLKKIEKDFKSAYTRKFQELGSKEQVWKQQQQAWEQEKEQVKQVALEILSDTENKKLEAYRQLYGIGMKAEAAPGIPDNIQTVGDLFEWNKQELARKTEQIQAAAERKAVETVERTTSIQKWKSALDAARKDKYFTKYEKFITLLTKEEPGIKNLYNGFNEKEVLDAAKEMYRSLQREDMELAEQALLTAQEKKRTAVTAVPSKTMPFAKKAAESRDEIIARIRERLGPPQASV